MLPEKECVGCAACEYACPRKCIHMEPNAQGFAYPVVNKDVCIHCGACEKVCQVINPVNKYALPQTTLAARIKEQESLQKSSSGGIAWLLSSEFLKMGGVVYGAAFDENMVVRHIRVTDNVGLKRIQGSKYVQSDLQNIYPQLKKDIEAGTKILFIGTPCQVAGIRKLFGERENLLLCDLFCHGVPSPKLFADHIREIEANGKKVADYRFRDKTYGWSYNLNRILYKDGSEELHSYWNQCYKRLFLLGYIERESCYSCVYKDCRRVGDISLGDYWGIEKMTDRFADDRGVNVVFINTEKAALIAETILRKKAEYMETTVQDALQKHLIMPCEKTARVDAFWKCYETTSYRNAAESFAGKYHYLTLRNGIKDFLREYRLLEHFNKRGKKQ